MSTTTAEADQQLLAIGKQCSHPQCNLIDFLPFKCQHCSESFCQEHYRVVDGHKCPKYDETKHNRVAPNCPLCNTPVSVKPGQDPNVRMEQHFEKECSVVTGRVQAKSTPLCGKATCKKVLFSPIRCDGCRGQFCPSHRFPSDHSCKAPTPARQTGPQARPNLPTFASASSSAKNLNAKASEAVTSMKQSVATAKANTNAAASSASKSLPFNKTDRPSLSALPLSRPLTTPTALNGDSTTTTNSPSPTNSTVIESNHESTIRPTPVINPLASFIPRPIFATA